MGFEPAETQGGLASLHFGKDDIGDTSSEKPKITPLRLGDISAESQR